MKMTADVPLGDAATAGALRSLLDAYSDDYNRVIPDEAEVEIVLTSTGGERMDPIRQVPSALRFTWMR